MPIFLNLDSAIFKWQAKHGERMTYARLARETGIALATLYRMKSGELSHPDLRKINEICKVLNCTPGDILERIATDELEEEKVDDTAETDAENEPDG